MAVDTKIQWCHHTFNPWRGCTKVSPGCTNCYAEKQSHRNPKVLGVWGDNGVRAIAAESYWREPLKWNTASAQAGERRRVFCASLADVFEDRADIEPSRQRLFDLILATPNLDWLLLTKRPEVMRDWLLGRSYLGMETGNAHAWGDGWPNVWLGTSVENQEQRKRIDVLQEIPAVVRFVSAEPLLEDIDITKYLYRNYGTKPNHKMWPHGPIKWVIVGGESGTKARPFRPEWALSIVRQCKQPGVACFVKQLGENIVCSNDELSGWPNGGDGIVNVDHSIADAIYQGADCRLHLADKKGGDMEEWPEAYRVREFPR